MLWKAREVSQTFLFFLFSNFLLEHFILHHFLKSFVNYFFKASFE